MDTQETELKILFFQSTILFVDYGVIEKNNLKNTLLERYPLEM